MLMKPGNLELARPAWIFGIECHSNNYNLDIN
jgi:hypothetical protein